MQRLLPPLLVLILLTAMTITSVLWPAPNLPWPMHVAGLALVVPGALLTGWHASLFNKLDTNINTFDDPDELVTSGAFAWTRNPMYLGFLALLTGAALLLGAWIALLGPLIFAVVANSWYIPHEERRMLATFELDYLRYQEQVRRWIGNL